MIIDQCAPHLSTLVSLSLRQFLQEVVLGSIVYATRVKHKTAAQEDVFHF